MPGLDDPYAALRSQTRQVRLWESPPVLGQVPVGFELALEDFRRNLMFEDVDRLRPVAEPCREVRRIADHTASCSMPTLRSHMPDG